MGHIADQIRRSIDAINRGDTAAYSSGYAPAALVYDPSYPEPLRGRQAIEQDIADLLRAFPDADATIGTLVEEGHQAAVEVTITGTQHGPWITPDGDLPPSGRPLVLRTCDLVRVDADGRYVENRRYYDVAGVIDQLTGGRAPTTGAASTEAAPLVTATTEAALTTSRGQ